MVATGTLGIVERSVHTPHGHVETFVLPDTDGSHAHRYLEGTTVDLQGRCFHVASKTLQYVPGVFGMNVTEQYQKFFAPDTRQQVIGAQA